MSSRRPPPPTSASWAGVRSSQWRMSRGAAAHWWLQQVLLSEELSTPYTAVRHGTLEYGMTGPGPGPEPGPEPGTRNPEY